jgi:hypothetical protein
MSNQQNSSFGQKIIFALDVIMIILVIIDISLIAFNSLFEVKIIRESLLGHFIPSFTNWYATHISQNFLLYESSIFIPIFLGELFFRWFLAVIFKTYDKWFFYPIYHWYDVLGCIPTSSFRILRFIRIFVLLYKLHRWKIINLNDYAVYRQIMHYYSIIVEEITDKVAVNLLEEAKEEIKRGEHLASVLVKNVVKPHRTEISEWTAAQMRKGIGKNYKRHRTDIQLYLRKVIKDSIETNRELGNLEKIPVLGAVISDSIHKAVADITFGVIDRITADLASEDKAGISDAIVSAVLDIIIAAENGMNEKQKQLMSQLVGEAVDLIISRVKEKKWKIAEQDARDDLNDIFY